MTKGTKQYHIKAVENIIKNIKKNKEMKPSECLSLLQGDQDNSVVIYSELVKSYLTGSESQKEVILRAILEPVESLQPFLDAYVMALYDVNEQYRVTGKQVPIPLKNFINKDLLSLDWSSLSNPSIINRKSPERGDNFRVFLINIALSLSDPVKIASSDYIDIEFFNFTSNAADKYISALFLVEPQVLKERKFSIAEMIQKDSFLFNSFFLHKDSDIAPFISEILSNYDEKYLNFVKNCWNFVNKDNVVAFYRHVILNHVNYIHDKDPGFLRSVFSYEFFPSDHHEFDIHDFLNSSVCLEYINPKIMLDLRFSQFNISDEVFSSCMSKLMGAYDIKDILNPLFMSADDKIFNCVKIFQYIISCNNNEEIIHDVMMAIVLALRMNGAFVLQIFLEIFSKDYDFSKLLLTNLTSLLSIIFGKLHENPRAVLQILCHASMHEESIEFFESSSCISCLTDEIIESGEFNGMFSLGLQSLVQMCCENLVSLVISESSAIPPVRDVVKSRFPESKELFTLCDRFSSLYQ